MLNLLIEEVLAPTIVSPPEHAHDLSAGVQRERTGLTQEDHIVDFTQHAVAFAPVAAVAAGHQVLPRRVAAAGARNYMIQRKFSGCKHLAAVLARVAVAKQNVFARQRARL